MKRFAAAGVVAAVVMATGVQAQNFEANPDFATVQKHLDPGGSFYLYMDADDFFSRLGTDLVPVLEMVGESPSSDSRAEVQPMIDFLRDRYPALGLGAIAGFGTSGRSDGSSGLVLSRSFLHLRGERAGVLKLTSTESRPAATLHFAPVNTMAFSTTRLAPARWLAMIREMAPVVSPTGGDAAVNQALATMDLGSGMPLQRILESLDGECTMAFAPQMEAKVRLPLGENRALVEVPRPDFYIALETKSPLLADSLKTRLAQVGLPPSDQKVEDLTVSVVPFVGFYPGCQFSFVHRGQFFYASNTSAELLAEAIRRQEKGSGGLADQEEFGFLSAGLPTEFHSLGFVSNRMVPLVTDVMVAITGADADPGTARLQGGMVGSMYGLEQRVSVARNTDEGVEWVTRGRSSTRTLVGALGVVPIGMAAAIAVPSFLRAREISRRNACQENLSKIDGAKQQWALETNKSAAAAPTWADLVGQNLYIRQTPVCPSGGTYTINSVASDPACSHSSVGSDPQFYHTFPGQ